jgi:hypothetical protein
MADAPPTTTLTANQLRWLAEKADGLRGDDEPLALVAGGELGVDIVREKDLAGREPIFDVRTPKKGDGVPGDATIQIVHNGTVYSARTKFGECDAVFVTQSAVEKFLLPYYMRFKTGAEVQQLQDWLFKNPLVLAGAHVSPSASVKINENGDPETDPNQIPPAQEPVHDEKDVFEDHRIAIFTLRPETKELKVTTLAAF